MNLFQKALGITIFFALLIVLTPVASAAECPTPIYGGGEIACGTPTPSVSAAPTQTEQQATATPTITPSPKATATPTPVKPTVTPTITPTKPQPTKPAQTKGGLPVHQPAKAKTTPPTGPEAFSLLGLLPAAAAGFYLRRKTK